MKNWLVIDTDDIPQRDRFDVWRDAFSRVHDVVVKQDVREDFRASCRTVAVRETTFGVYEAPARRIVRTDSHRSKQDLDHWVVKVPLHGGIKGRQRGKPYHIGAGQVWLGTMADGYEEAHCAGELVMAVLPRSSLPFVDERNTRRLLNGAQADFLRDLLLSVCGLLAKATTEDAMMFEQTFRHVLESAMRGGDGGPGAEDRRMRRIDEVLRSEIGSARLSVSRICELAGVSRSTLYRLFSERGGVESHVTGLRLDLIRRDLEAPSLGMYSISQIAQRRGMHNASSFHRAFHRRFGCTPGDIRAGAGVPLSPQHPQEPIQPRQAAPFLGWLRADAVPAGSARRDDPSWPALRWPPQGRA